MLSSLGDRLRILAAVVLVLCSLPVAAQSVPDTLFDAPTRIELERIITSARQSGLPTAPLVNRALQGAARRVDANRVLGIVRSYADSMRVALTLLGAGSAEGEIDAGAAALRAGVSRDGIRQVRSTRGAGHATTALIVLTDLVRRGVSPADAASAVTTVAQAQSDNALLSLQSTIAREAAAPTPAQLRDAVQRQLRQRPPVPDGARDDALVRALDGRSSPSVGHAAYLALSGLDPAPASTGVLTAAEGGLGLPLGRGLTLYAGTRAGSDVTDSLVMQLRSGVSFMRPVGARGAVATWLGVESRPWRFAASSGGDSVDSGDFESRLDARPGSGITFVGGTSVARAIGPRLALGALVELQSDRIVTRSLVPRYLEPTGPRPDTLTPIRYDEHLQSDQRLFVHSALNAIIGSLAIQGTFVHRLRGQQDTARTHATRSLFLLSAEHQVGAGMSLFASMSSREPTDVLGTVLPTDGRVRLGARFVERRALEHAEPDHTPRVPMGLTLERATTDGTRAAVRVSLRAPEAREVLVEGDFTNWQPAALTVGVDGRFAGIFPVESEVVRFRLRVDGGPWQVPPGVAVDVDDFGGVVGIALVR